MKRLFSSVMVGLLGASAAYEQALSNQHCDQYEDYIQHYNRAVSSNHYLPQPLVNSAEEAYIIQSCLVSNNAKEVIGFKAGLTSNVSRKRFGTNETVLGVLTNGSLHPTNEFLVEDNKTILIETELAFRLRNNIYALDDLDREVEELVDSVAPAIEMPLFHFKDVSALTGNDIIAANVGANKLLLGKFVPIDKVDINSIKVSLNKGGKEIANSLDTFSNNRLQLIRWLIKKSYLEGYTLRKGTIYLTGSLMKPVIMEKGSYFADFTQIDDIVLIVK